MNPPANPPLAMVHLGMGNFFRAHQAWYTHHAPDRARWGVAAFAGRGAGRTADLIAQHGRYTLVTRGPHDDRFEEITALTEVHPAADHQRWVELLADPHTAVVTVTVTEAGYGMGADGHLDLASSAVRADIETLRRDVRGSPTTAPAKLVAGLAARSRTGAGPLAVVPCDNLAGNDRVVTAAISELAEAIDPGLAADVDALFTAVATVVDRITPRATEADVALVRQATGRPDRAPVVTEPFSEWVLAGEFPGGRPCWESAGATFAADVAPFARRKLWMLNGAHSLLAYLGSARGHRTVAEAMDDEICRAAVQDWWSESAAHLDLPRGFTAAGDHTDALAERFSNPRIEHLLTQIAADGSKKVPERILPTVRVPRSAGTGPGAGAVVLAAWLAHLRGAGAPIDDVRGPALAELARGPLPQASSAVLATFGPDLADDTELVQAVAAHTEAIERTARPHPG